MVSCKRVFVYVLGTVLAAILSKSLYIWNRFPFSAADRSSDQFAPREVLAPRAIQFPLVVLALQVVADIFACVCFGLSGADHMCW
jgi:hypothetical protein